MSITTIIFIILAIVFVVAYFRSLPTAMRSQQAKLLANGATTAAFTLGKVGKEVVSAASKAGVAAANEVQLSHKEKLNEIEQAFDAKLAEYGGSTRRYGVAIGDSINDALMISAANKNLNETIAAQRERAAKIEEYLASQAK